MNAKSPHIRTRGSLRANRRTHARLEMAAVVALGVLLVVAACTTSADPSVDSTRAHSVKSGDTLWTLAEETRAPNQTIEQAMDVIASLNDVEDGRLIVGSTIEVPAEADMSTAQAMR